MAKDFIEGCVVRSMGFGGGRDRGIYRRSSCDRGIGEVEAKGSRGADAKRIMNNFGGATLDDLVVGSWSMAIMLGAEMKGRITTWLGALQ